MDYNKRNLIKAFMYTCASLPITKVYSKPSIPRNEYFFPVDKLIYKATHKITYAELKTLQPEEGDFYIIYEPNHPNLYSDLYIAYRDKKNIGQDNTSSARNGLTWLKVDYDFTLEDFGAISNPDVDSTAFIQAAFDSGLKLTSKTDGKYLLKDTIFIENIPWYFQGAGMSKTVFFINHFKHAFVFGSPKPSDVKYPVNLKGFTIKRLDGSLYKGTAGAKGLYIGNGLNVNLSYIEECYGLGYGLHIDYSDQITVSHCHIHDHKGMAAGAAGTDGIHFYRSKNINAFNNLIHDIGDDALSAGSFDINYPTKNVIFKNNTIYSTKGGIKFYSFVQDAIVQANRLVGCREGSVYLTDDKNSPDNSLVENIVIKNNSFNFIGVFGKSDEAGALRIRFWPKVNIGSKVKNIVFSNNEVLNSRLGISELAYNDNKRLSNLYILKNKFSFDKKNHVGIIKNHYITITQCDNDFVIKDNDFITHVENVLIINDKFSSVSDMNISTNNNFIDGNYENKISIKIVSSN